MDCVKDTVSVGVAGMPDENLNPISLFKALGILDTAVFVELCM
jgi:hypothetical protein